MGATTPSTLYRRFGFFDYHLLLSMNNALSGIRFTLTTGIKKYRFLFALRVPQTLSEWYLQINKSTRKVLFSDR